MLFRCKICWLDSFSKGKTLQHSSNIVLILSISSSICTNNIWNIWRGGGSNSFSKLFWLFCMDFRCALSKVSSNKLYFDKIFLLNFCQDNIGSIWSINCNIPFVFVSIDFLARFTDLFDTWFSSFWMPDLYSFLTTSLTPGSWKNQNNFVP